jgi:hypothetical protein
MSAYIAKVLVSAEMFLSTEKSVPPLTPNVFQIGVRFLLVQFKHLSANPQKMTPHLVLPAGAFH